MRSLLTILLFILFLSFSKAQTVFFEKSFGGYWSDFSQVIKEYDDGSLFIGGYSDSASQNGSFDPCLTKLDKFGNWLWTKHYQSTESDYGFYMSVLRDKKIMMVGEMNVGGVNEVEILLLKVDTAGNLIWKKTFGGPGSQSIEYCDTTADGNLILCGYAVTANGDLDELLIKADTAGNVIWQKTHGGSLTDYGDFVKQTTDGGFIVSSVTASFGAGSTDGWIQKLDMNGDTLWTHTSGNQYAGGCQGVCVTQDGSYILFGEEETSSGSWFNFWMAKYDVAGNLKWKKVFGGSGSDALFNVIETTDKGFYCSGYSNSYNGNGPLDLIFLKTDSLGNMQWKKTFGGTGIDIAYDMIRSKQGGFIITGQTEDPVYQNQYYVLHLDSLGNLTGLPDHNSTINFTLAPNPATDFIHIGLYICAEYEIELSDARGALLFREKVNTGDYLLPLTNYASGIYFIKVKTEKGDAVKKLILQSVQH